MTSKKAKVEVFSSVLNQRATYIVNPRLWRFIYRLQITINYYNDYYQIMQNIKGWKE
ncbi:unnamed protein product [Nezara viridula]|uniref:Uncharacterized protein n=1 Tax=Nezara viridula TaxID=85310 RepID=A0A9P0MV15_NEZVI|nr:unnamed protein product [Nezara viridula]